MSAPAIGLRSRWLPPATASLDPSHPLAGGMLAAMVPARRADLVGQRPLTSVGTSSALVDSAFGQAGEQTANGAPAYFLRVSPTYPTNLSCVIVAHKRSGTSSRCGLAVFSNFDNSSESGTGGFSVGYGSGASNGWDTASADGNMLFVLHHSTAWRGFNAGTFQVPDGPVVIGIANTGGTSAMGYVNGVAASAAVTTGAATGALYATIGTSTTGSRGAGAGRCATAALLIWNRVLSAREMADLAADPFQMFRY